MKNLVTFGCSNTIGEGLEDSPPMSEKISAYSWPAVLAAKLNRNMQNMGKAGASNLQILSEILDHRFCVEDIVIVMWSFPERDVVFSEDKNHTRLGTWSVGTENIGEYAKEWIAASTDYDLHTKSWLAIHQAYELLTILNIQFHFVDIQQNSAFLANRPEWAKEIEFMPFSGNKYFLTLPKADDNIHPGKEWHKLMAEIISMGVFNE